MNATVSSHVFRNRFRVIMPVFCFLMYFSFSSIHSYGTAWTTVTAGPVTTLSNWSDGSVSPTTFTNPGDTWTVTMAMTMSPGPAWTLGTMSMAPDSLIMATGGTISMTGAGSTFPINVYGDLVMNGGTITLGGAGTTCNVSVYGVTYVLSGTAFSTTGAGSVTFINNYGDVNMSGGSYAAGGAGGGITHTISGTFAATGGTMSATGAGCTSRVNVKGDCTISGTFAMTITGAGGTSSIHFALPSALGVMNVDNTSTGTWSATNIYVDTFCTAQLDGNFSTTTGAAAYGLTVNGTLICPAAYVVNGSRMFSLDSGATLEVAIPTGVNGAITNTGTKTFSNYANFVFNGSAPQVTGTLMPVSLLAPDTITVANTAGVTLSQTSATTGTLLFTSGILHTGAFTMSVPGAPASVSGAGASSYVDGTLIKTINGYTSVNYEVGDADYAPMQLTLSSAGTAGSIGLKCNAGLHPSVATSGLSSANMANHYWTITDYSAAGPAAIIPKATYNAVDIIGGSNLAFVSQEFSASSWLGSPLTSANTVSPYTSQPTSGIALATISGDYIFGNVFCGTLPITGASAFCAGTTISLSDPTTGGAWSSASPGIATVSSSGVVTGVSGGTATISYTVSGCVVTTIVTVNPLPNAGTITGIDTIVCVGSTKSFSDASPGGTWGLTNTSLATISGSGTVTGVAPGIDSVTYTVTNGCGTARAKFRIKVLSAVSCSHLAVGGAGTPDERQLLVFPNPNTGSFTLRLTSPDEQVVRITITNVMGQKIREFTVNTNESASLSLDHIPGLYYISAHDSGGVLVAKLLVE